jgi:hypothetical protein
MKLLEQLGLWLGRGSQDPINLANSGSKAHVFHLFSSGEIWPMLKFCKLGRCKPNSNWLGTCMGYLRRNTTLMLHPCWLQRRTAVGSAFISCQTSVSQRGQQTAQSSLDAVSGVAANQKLTWRGDINNLILFFPSALPNREIPWNECLQFHQSMEKYFNHTSNALKFHTTS